MIRKLMALVCLLSLGAYVRADDDTAKKDLDALQGKWKVTSIEFEGQAPPDGVPENFHFEFEKDVMAVDGPRAAAEGEKEPEKPTVKITLDPSTTPKTIKLKAINGPKKGETISGIYEIEKDGLKLCIPNFKDVESPKEFKTTKGSRLALFVMKKAKE